MAQINVRDITGRGVPRINIRLSEGTQPSDAAIYDMFTDLAGNTGWPVPYFPVQRYALHVNFANVNPAYVPQSYYLLESDMSEDVQITLEHTPLTRLHVESRDFYNEHGQRVFIKGATDFLLYKKFLDGENIDGLLTERAVMGANCVRVIGMVNSFAHWFPQEYGNAYYDRLPEFCAKVAAYGMYAYFTVFADSEHVFAQYGSSHNMLVAQLQHWNRITAVLRTIPNVIGEFCNEPYAHENAVVDYTKFGAPGFLCSGGSYNDRLGDELRPVPSWESFHDFHSPRDGKDDENASGFKTFSDQNACSHPEYKYRHKAIISGEPQKAADPADPRRGGSTMSNPKQFRKMAGSARGTMAGIFFHSASGVFSTPWNDVERRCAEAWFNELEAA